MSKKKKTNALDDLVVALSPVIKDQKVAVALALAGYFLDIPENVQSAVIGYVGGETLQRLLEDKNAKEF